MKVDPTPNRGRDVRREFGGPDPGDSPRRRCRRFAFRGERRITVASESASGRFGVRRRRRRWRQRLRRTV